MKDENRYFKQIAVRGLWGKSDVIWELNPNVSILSGINGSGKSTLIQAVAAMFKGGIKPVEEMSLVDSVEVLLSDGEVISSLDKMPKSFHNVDIISTFDASLKDSESLQRLSDGDVRTDLDWNIYQLQKRYLSYQLAQGKQTIELLKSNAPKERLDALISLKIRFFDLIDELFANSNKKIDRESDELSFIVGSTRISPYKLSSGEKQMLVIVTTVLTQNHQHYTLLMDEPEISLHFDWQQRLIETILDLNPNVQIIMATHSPAVIMNGWMEHVSEMSEITTSL